MNFSEALYALKGGADVIRSGWNGKNMWVRLEIPQMQPQCNRPYLVIEYPLDHPACPDGCRVPWLASQTDLLAEDWEVRPVSYSVANQQPK